MDLTTNYLGMELAHPIIPGASPQTADLDLVKRLEDQGAPAIVMHSLFEEQIVSEQMRTYAAMEYTSESSGEALSYLPEPDQFSMGPDQYLDQIRRIKESVGMKVIGSLNGTTRGGWLEYAQLIAQAGADALELNIYDPVTTSLEDSNTIEARAVGIVREVKSALPIPVTVKLAPYYTSLAHFATQLVNAGVDGLVLFNRLYQPDIDLDELEMIRVSPVGLGDLPMRMRWLGVLHDRVSCSLAASGGIGSALDAVKVLMAGADVAQMVSALLIKGPTLLSQVRRDLSQWLEINEYHSLDELRGSMSMTHCPDPSAYHRANYMRTLLSWRS